MLTQQQQGKIHAPTVSTSKGPCVMAGHQSFFGAHSIEVLVYQSLLYIDYYYFFISLGTLLLGNSFVLSL